MNRTHAVTPGKGRRPFPVAVKHVCKLIGSCQPSIILTTGCKFYVTKCQEFTGQYGLMKEVIGTELMGQMGLPVPEWSPVSLDDEFIRKNQSLWFYQEMKKGVWGGVRPHPGLHFGSRLTRSDKTFQTYAIIPPEWTSRVVNRDDFVGALLVGLWTNNCDRLQAVFVTSDSGKSFRAVFIDHGHMFGGLDCNLEARMTVLLRSHGEICQHAWTKETVARWRRRLEAIDDRCLDTIFDKIPPEWAGSHGPSIVRSQLATRRKNLNSLLVQMSRALSNWKRHASLPALRVPVLQA